MKIDARKKSGMAQKNRNHLLFYSICIALPLLQFAIFWVGANFQSIMFTFQDYDLEKGKYYFVGLDNLKTIFYNFQHDATFLQMLKNSLIGTFLTLIISVPCALLFSFYIAKKMPANGFFQIMLFLPSVISTVVLTLLFRYFVDRFIPEFIGLFKETEFAGFLSEDRYQFATLVFYSIFVSFGATTLMYSSAMSGIDESIIEAGQIDGCNTFQEFIHITFPSIYSTFSVFIVTTVATIFSNQLHQYTFYLNGDGLFSYNRTLGYHLYRETVLNNVPQSYPILAAYGFVYSIASIIITFAVRWVLNKLGPKTE